jgi:hypothetical protein
MAAKTYVVGRFNRVYRLDNHTGSWQNISPGIVQQNVNNTWLDVMTDPDDLDKVIIVGENIGPNQGILVSTNAGQSWTAPSGNWNQAKNFYEVWFVDSNIIFVVADSGKVFKSLDGGVSFNAVTQINVNTVPYGGNFAPRFTTTINAISTGTGNNDQTIVVAGSPTISDQGGGLGSAEAWAWKSIDGGNTWTVLNSNSSLDPGGGAAVGSPEGSWIDPANPLNIIISTVYGQHLSVDGGITFSNNPDTPARSGRHLTWYPTYAPTVFRHVGGIISHVTESTDAGATWSVTRQGEGITIRGAHFYTNTNGYYTVNNDVFATTTEGLTGTLSFSDPNGDQVWQAVWTTVEQPPQPCYKFTSCDEEVELVWNDPILAQYVGVGVVELTISVAQPFTLCGTVTVIQNTGETTGIALPVGGGPIINVDLGSAACSQAEAIFDTQIYQFGSETYIDCEECIVPDSDTRCYNLISCREDCPDIRYAISDQLDQYIGQYISLNGDLNCRYLVEATRQAYFNSLQTSDLSDPGSQFQLGNETWNIELNSVLVDGIEYINNPATPYILTNTNYSVVECSELVCTPVTVNTTENCVTNIPSYYNQVFANNSIPLSAECADPVYNCGNTDVEVIKIQYNEGSTFIITATFTSSLTGSYQVIYQVAAGNVSQFIIYPPGIDPIAVDTCNDETQCTGTAIEITQVDVFEDCTFPTQAEIGEACETTPRIGEPGFSAKNCDPKKIIAVKNKYADSVYALFKRMRYGIETCCEFDLDKIDVKNMLVDFGFLYDPDLCIIDTPVIECCLPPCNAVAQVLVPNYITCDPPVDVTTVITLDLACCIDIKIYNGPGYGEAVLTTPSGTFGNGQPYWQFELNNPAPPLGDGLPTGIFVELSQINGVGDWKLYTIPTIPSIPNSGTEVLTAIDNPTIADCPSDLPIPSWVVVDPAWDGAETNACDVPNVPCDEPTGINDNGSPDVTLNINPVALACCGGETIFRFNPTTFPPIIDINFETSFQIFIPKGTYNGREYYTALIEGALEVTLWYDGINTWYITESPLGDTGNTLATLNTQACPYGLIPPGLPAWNPVNTELRFMSTKECTLNYDVDAGDFLVQYIDDPFNIAILNKNNPDGTYNGQKYWQFEFLEIIPVGNEFDYTPSGNLFEISFDTTWKMYEITSIGQPAGTGTLAFTTNNSTSIDPSAIVSVERDPNGWATVGGPYIDDYVITSDE